MAKFSDDFLRFLYANFPDDWRRASVSDVADDVVAAITSKHARHYQIWKEVPEWIKSRYGDKLPADVLNGNETPQQFVVEETQKVEKEEKDTAEMMSFAVDLLALGYAAETVKLMAENRALREELLRQNGGKPISLKAHPELAELFAKWIESRKKDIMAITKDWKKHQPEKHMLHLAMLLSREKKRQKRLSSKEDIAKSEARIKRLEKKIREVAKRLDSRAVKMNMVDYLRGRPQQAALRHMTPDVLRMFSGLLEEQGIRISPVKSVHDKHHTLVDRESFTKDLQNALDKIEQQSKSAKGISKLTKAIDNKVKKSKNKGAKKNAPHVQEPKTTLTLKKVPTLEII